MRPTLASASQVSVGARLQALLVTALVVAVALVLVAFGSRPDGKVRPRPPSPVTEAAVGP